MNQAKAPKPAAESVTDEPGKEICLQVSMTFLLLLSDHLMRQKSLMFSLPNRRRGNVGKREDKASVYRCRFDASLRC